MAFAMPCPCSGPQIRVRRISRSKVPCSRSSCSSSRVDIRPEIYGGSGQTSTRTVAVALVLELEDREPSTQMRQPRLRALDFPDPRIGLCPKSEEALVGLDRAPRIAGALVRNAQPVQAAG